MTLEGERQGGLRIADEIGRGAMSTVYRATRAGMTYALKVFSNQDAAGQQRVRREAAALARLTHPNLARVFELGEHDGQPCILMELVEGESLAKRLARGPIEEPLVVRVAISTASALAAVHRQRLVHRDVKPDNLVVAADGTAKLIDFGFVGATDAPDAQSAFVGTFRYASPEQIGILKRRVDGRSDLYSLGCVLFECGAGAPPFEAPTVAELIRQHAATPAPDVRSRNASLSPAFAAIVAKLLAKDPDDRYQSAEGLLADLTSLGAINREIAVGGVPLLGTRDVAVQKYDVPLIGRDDELRVLESIWGRVCGSGRGATVLVEGEPGSGKTRLVREWIKRGSIPLVLAGKCQAADSVPFGAIREALDDYLSPLLRLPPKKRQEATAQLLRAAGDFAPLLRRLSRTLERLLDVPGEAQEFEDADRERFYGAVAHLLVGLAKNHGGAILCIDDIQWLDRASMQVLIRLKDRLGSAALLVVATSRNDASTQAITERFVSEMGDMLSARLSLAPLQRAALESLVSVHLGGEHPDAALVERVMARSNGNPFVAEQYLWALLEGGAIKPTSAGFRVDVARLNALELPTDVLDLVIKRLATLSDETKRVLRTAAIVGSPFSTVVVARVIGIDPDKVVDSLSEAEHVGLVDPASRDEYVFVHDRIQEALTHALTAEQQRGLHQAVADVLELLGGAAPGGVRALAHHYALGDAKRHCDRVFTTSLAAGLESLDSFANEEGLDFLRRARDLVADLPVTVGDRYLLEEGLGRACMRLGQHTEAVEHFHAALPLASTAIERAVVCERLAQLYSERSMHQQDFARVVEGLAALGEPLPTSSFATEALIQWNTRMISIMEKHGLGYGSAKDADLVKRKILARLYKHGIYSCTYSGRTTNDVYLLQSRALINAHLLGDRRESIEALATYGSVLAERRYSTSRACFQRATRIAEQQGDRPGLAYARLYEAAMHSQLGEIRVGTAMNRENFAESIPWLGAFDQAAWASTCAYDLVCQGRVREALERIQWGLEKQRTAMAGSPNVRFLVGVELPACYALLGDLRDAARLSREMLELASSPEVSRECGLFEIAAAGTAMFVHREEGEVGKPLLDAIARYEAQNLAPKQLPYHYRLHAVRWAYALLELAKAATAEPEQGELHARTLRAIDQVKVGCAQPVFMAHVRVITAAIMRARNKLADAERLLGEARRDAELADSPWAALEIATEAAALAQEREDMKTAHAELSVARELAGSEGYRHRVRLLERQLAALERGTTSPGIAPHTPSMGVPSSRSRGNAQTGSLADRYLDALLRVSLASTSTLKPDTQAQAVLEEMLRLLGAERGFLFEADRAGGPLRLLAGRNSDGTVLPEAAEYSTTVVAQVLAQRKALVVTGTEEGVLLGSESAAVYDLRSIVAAPLAVRDKLLGVLYLDSRLARGLFTEDDLLIMSALANHVAISIESARNARLEIERKALDKEMELTAAAQALFLPRSSKHTHGGVSLYGVCRPAERCGGDFWWYGTHEGALTVLVGDVLGHGAASAFVTAAVATGVRYLTRASRAPDVADMLRKLHDDLRELADGLYHMTVACLRVSLRDKTVDYWTAGAPHPFVLTGDGGLSVLSESGTPLGSSQFELGYLQRSLAARDRIFIFTDGLDEMRIANGRRLGRRRLLGALQEATPLPLDEAVRQVLERSDALRGAVPLYDDVTLVALECDA